MKLEDQVISLDLAKRMKELGFVQESLWYWQEGTHYTTYVCNIVSSGISNSNKEAWCGNREDYSAYTVAELGEMLPTPLLEKYHFTCSKYGSEWECWFEKWNNNGYCERAVQKDIMNQYATTEADARAKMLIYLKENNLL